MVTRVCGLSKLGNLGFVGWIRDDADVLRPLPGLMCKPYIKRHTKCISSKKVKLYSMCLAIHVRWIQISTNYT